MTEQLYVIGTPIQHSKSPMIHQHWMQMASIDAQYDAMEILPEKLERRMLEFRAGAVLGFNITIPHKHRIIPLLDGVDDNARAIGAVNTVSRTPDGKYIGHNTDAYGFIENIKHHCPDWKADAGPATIFGAGGAAYAAVYALHQAGCPEIRIINRTPEKAEALAKHFNLPLRLFTMDKQEEALKGAKLIANTTSCGMNGQDDLHVHFESIDRDAVIYDIVYKPLQTRLLRDATAAGLTTVTGIGMLLYQAQAAFELWFDIIPPVDPYLINKVLNE